MHFTKLKLLIAFFTSTLVVAEKCDHTPSMVSAGVEPRVNDNFQMTVQNQGEDPKGKFSLDQRYAITLRAINITRPFRWFMITVEDPDVDKSNYEFKGQRVDVGSLKTLDDDRKAKYNVKCLNTVENTDNSEKDVVSVHWLSPKQTPQNEVARNVRIRAMVAENSETWYISPDLSVTLAKNDEQAIDTPQIEPREYCNLCSEARYEVIFKGQWSKLTHPHHFPENMNQNAYSFMVGASHDYLFTLWKPDAYATIGLKKAAEDSDMHDLEQEIIRVMGKGTNSTRTLIRGRRNAHPDMFNPSHALFRVDPMHHMFSLVIGIQPSPDWFLGAYKFELCTDDGWHEYEKLPLYPWDAGTMDGVSYTSSRKMSSPTDPIARVALGSFDRESPFYQINLNDLHPFGHLEVTLLDVYPLKDCPAAGAESDDAENLSITNVDEEDLEEPQMSEVRIHCGFSEWQPWSPCTPDGHCGSGSQYRQRYRMDWNYNYRSQIPNAYSEERCIADPDKMDTEYQECYVDCY